jgi:hypothetical protein
MRIEAKKAAFSREGLAVFSGSVYLFSHLLKIDFDRLSFTNPKRMILEDVSFLLEGWERVRAFPVLALLVTDTGLELELLDERIHLANAAQGNSINALFHALQNCITEYMRGLLPAHGVGRAE